MRVESKTQKGAERVQLDEARMKEDLAGARATADKGTGPASAEEASRQAGGRRDSRVMHSGLVR